MSGTFHSADATVAAKRAVNVIPSDSTVIPVTRSLYLGTGGDIRVRMAEDQGVITFPNVAAGFFSVQVDQIYSTSTTAADIIALY